MMLRKRFLGGLDDQLSTPSSKKSRKEVHDTEEILNFLKTSNKCVQKMLELIDNTLSVSSPDLKRSCCRWMEASFKDIHPSSWRSFRDQYYEMKMLYLDHSAAIQQGYDWQS